MQPKTLWRLQDAKAQFSAVVDAALHGEAQLVTRRGKRDALTAAMHKVTVDSPRGKFTISPAGNPVQDIYLREVKGNNNEYRSIAVKALADPARGCKL